MSDHPAFEKAVGKLRQLLVRLQNSNEVFQSIVEPRDAVLAIYQPIFSLNTIDQLSEQQFKDFLLFENNKHWSGLHRMGTKICSDMNNLRKSLKNLLDETQAIEDRLDKTVNAVSGMGKAIITAILLIAYPEKYGVWNSTSEGALKTLDLWPKFERGASFGNRYSKINQLLLRFSDELQIDLWTLDALWWSVQYAEESKTDETIISDVGEPFEVSQRFGLEKHLHEFLRDNWNQIPLGQEWEIYSEPGDEEAGYEYPCGKIGYIDILAHHRQKPRWLVIELKRNQSSDKTVGQILRYIGWVQTHLAEPDDTVQGLVISHEADDSIKYALKPLNNIELQLYEVEFRLHPATQD